MSTTAENLKPYLASVAGAGLQGIAAVLEDLADLAQRLPPGSDLMRDNLAAVDEIVERAEQLHGAARRCRHAMRQNVRTGD